MKKVVSYILAAVMCLSLCACAGVSSASSIKAENSVLTGARSEDGGYVVPMLPGKYTTKKLSDLDDDIKWAAVTPDRNNIVYLTEEGTLYAIAADAVEAEKIASNVSEVDKLENSGLVYKEQFDNSSDDLFVYYRYTFSDKEIVKLGLVYKLIYAEDSLDMAYVLFDGIENRESLKSIKDLKMSVRILKNDSVESETLSTISYDNIYDVTLLAISENANKLIWSEEESSTSGERVYIYADGDKDVLCSVDGSVINVQYNNDMSLITFTDRKNSVFYAAVNGDTEKYRLPNDISWEDIYTDKGEVSESTSSTKGFYVSCYTGNSYYNYDLYWVDNEGDREKIAENLQDYRIINDKIIYLDEEDRLYSAKLSEREIIDETKIAGDVEGFYLANDGETIYYYKDLGGSNVWTLFAYTGKGDPEKISSEAAGVYSPLFYISDDAKYVYYFEDIEKVGSRYCGTLMKYSLKDKESTKIAGEVLTYSLSDGKAHDDYIFANTIDSDCFMYKKYLTDDGTDVVYNLVLFDGKDSKVIADNLTTAENSKKTETATEAADY
jgi:hypothetical protein